MTDTTQSAALTEAETIALAHTYLEGLTAGTNFTVPVVSLDGPNFQIPSLPANSSVPLTEAQLTSRVPNGSGMFDGLMQSMRAHLQTEHEKGRITGAQYAEVYIASMTAGLSSAVQYLLQKDQSYWQSVLAERQAAMAQVELVSARIAAEEAKVRLGMTRIQAETARVEYALKKQSLALAAVTFESAELQRDTQQFNLDVMLPAQLAGVNKDNEIKAGQLDRIQYENLNMLPAQLLALEGEIAAKTAQKDQVLFETASVLPAQVTKLTKEGSLLDYQLTHLMPAQVAALEADVLSKEYNNDFLLPAQLANLREQTEGHRAKTLDTRTDGLVISGAMGIQKELQEQQIVSYQRDAETKAVRMMLDTWATQKSVDEGVTAPSSLANPNIDTVFNAYLQNLALKAPPVVGP